MKVAAVLAALVLGLVNFGESQRVRPFNNNNNDNNETIKYVLIFPAVIQQSRDFSFHMTLFPNETAYKLPVSFTANLTANDVLVASQTFQQDKYGLVNHVFTSLAGKIPGDETYMRMTVAFNNATFKNYTDIMAGERTVPDKFVFIQTDKMMYKPTHTVQLRIVAVDRLLKPLSSRAINVTIQDPKENQMKAWINQTLVNGTFNASYTLSDFVNIGDWKISIEGQGIPKTERSFTVQQYVLPKYEVKLDFSLPRASTNYWLFNANNESGYTGFVRAKYTFGKSVKGIATITLTSTGGCSFAYDNPSFFSDMGIKLGESKQQTITKLVVTKMLKGDGSDDDGSFTLYGLNKNVTYSPPLPQIQYGDNNNVQTTTAMPTGIKLTSPQCQLTLNATVTEQLTGEVVSIEDNVMLYRDPYTISVHDSVQKTLKPGLPFTMKFKVTTPDGVPVKNILVKQEVFVFNDENAAQTSYVHCGYSIPGNNSSPRPVSTEDRMATDGDGIVYIKVTVEKNISSAIFRAQIDGSNIEFCDSRSPPQTFSKQAISISIDRPNDSAKTIPKVGDTLKFKIEATFSASMVYFMIVQNGQPLLFEQLNAPDSQSDVSTKFTVNKVIPLEATPRCAVVVWTVENKTGEILADAVEFKIDGLVRQTLTASFSPALVAPGKATNLTVTTSEPNSFVGLLAVDKSVRLLRSGNDITLEDVLGAVTDTRLSFLGASMPLLWRCWFCPWWPSWLDSSNAERVFSGVGMVIKSNVKTGYASFPMILMARSGSTGDEGTGPLIGNRRQSNSEGDGRMYKGGQETTSVRVLFPETWLWNGTNTNNYGSMMMSLTAPDTITSWVLTAFSIGPNNGFGALEKPAELTVFQDFFVDINIAQPTIIRGEQVQIKAVVFNYQNTDETIALTLSRSSEFSVRVGDQPTYKVQDYTAQITVKANSGSSVPIWIQPNRLGTIKMQLTGRGRALSDSMIKEILVEPEGEVRYANKPKFVRLASNQQTNFKINVNDMLGAGVTNDVIVNGSKMFQLQVIGDILGPSLSVDSQIRLPTGCGEQTMVILAPNVYIYKYLKAVNQLTDELATKTSSFVDQGYRRELGYQREDGGFSAFGANDPASSTWLTAFVLRCFAAAKKYVGTQIDDTPVNNAWQFLKRQARGDGSYGEPGRVIHASMKGGADGDVNLLTYIYTTSVEAGVDSNTFPSLTNTRSRIIRVAKSSEDAFQLAIISYALSLQPNDKVEATIVFKRLMAMATNDSDFTYWKPSNDKSSNAQYGEAGPTQIETSAYALLALLNIVDTVDDALPIGRWLMSKRNSLGGFISTQDTVVGLQALAELASRLQSGNQALTISATLNYGDRSSENTTFTINPSNSKTLQSFDPSRATQSLTTVDVVVQGSGVALVQLALRYNINDHKLMNTADYTIEVSRDSPIARRKRRAADSDSLPESFDNKVTLKACVSSRQSRPGMVLLEVGIPTGFDGDIDSTQKSNQLPNGTYFKKQLKRIELANRKLVFYFDSLEDTRFMICVKANLVRIAAAMSVQPAIARAYAYYEPSLINAIQYKFEGISAYDITACETMSGVACPETSMSLI